MNAWRKYRGLPLFVLSILVTILVIVVSCATQAPVTTSPPTSSPTPDTMPSDSEIVPSTPPTSPAPVPGSTDISESVNNNIEVCFETRWEYESSENSFTNQEVTGSEYWFARMSNTPDETEAAVAGLALTLDTELKFDRFNEENLIQTGPPTYEWVFGDVPPVDEYPQESPRVHVSFYRPGPFPVTFTPGFDASCTANRTEFSEPRIQTLTIELTPRDGTGIFTIWVSAGEDDLVNAVIISPSTDEKQGIWLDPDGRWLDINLEGLEIDMIYTYAITIEVTPKVPNIEFMPSVNVHHVEHIVTGTDTGSSTSHLIGGSEGEIGTWTWRADGNYTWRCGETLERIVAFAKLGK